MTAAAAGGTVSEQGMAKLFTDLAAEDKNGKTNLSSSQFSDLKTIAADLNVGETASAYVTYATDALILGNAANATWTGGAAASVKLGNLAAGASPTQISELDGKWFLGTDLPSDVVAMSGASKFTVSYSANSNPLYVNGAPSISDVNQGYLGDCYLESVLAEAALQNPSKIESMITSNGNNTYGVRFDVNGVAEYVTVSNKLADGGTIFNSGPNGSTGPDIWASIVEQGYAELQAGGNVSGGSGNTNSWTAIGNGGYPELTLLQVTGASSVTDFNGGSKTWSEDVYNDLLNVQSASSNISSASVLSAIVTDLAKGDDVILSSNTNAYASNGMQTLVSDHAMSVYGYDSHTGMLEIRNPWGTYPGQTWDTTFEVSMQTLLTAQDTISIDNAGGVGSLGGSSTPAKTSATAIGPVTSPLALDQHPVMPFAGHIGGAHHA